MPLQKKAPMSPSPGGPALPPTAGGGGVVLAKSFSEKRIQENFQVHGRLWAGGVDRGIACPLVWVIGEAVGVYGGKAHVLVHSVHSSVIFS